MVKYLKKILLFMCCISIFSGCISTSNPITLNDETDFFMLTHTTSAYVTRIGNHKYTFPEGKYKAIVSTDEGKYYLAPNVVFLDDSSAFPISGIFITKSGEYAFWLSTTTRYYGFDYGINTLKENISFNK